MNNREKNSYVRTQITATLLRTMETEDFAQIAIGTLVKNAGVARASFYRNYQTKEHVIQEYLAGQLKVWKKRFEASGETNPVMLFASLFEHLKENQHFYLLLHRQHLSHLLLDYILSDCGPKSEHSAFVAYQHAFFAYGLFGWIEEWIHRGMVEDADKIATMFIESQQDAQQVKP